VVQPASKVPAREPIAPREATPEPGDVTLSRDDAAAAAGETSIAEPAPLAFLDSLDEATRHKLVVSPDVSAASREQYRALAAALHRRQAESNAKVVMIASAVAGEGKTLTAANLALTFSESYQRRVLLVDADLRRPALHLLLGVESPAAVGRPRTRTAGVLGDISPEEDAHTLPVKPVTARLDLLTTGEPSDDPMADLTSDRMTRLLERAREIYDWVIIDTPPVGLLPDAGLVATLADRAILVVRAESTPYTLVARAADALGRTKIAGVLLNGAADHVSSAGYQYRA
jgi:capsular exopolysaccharide synthesis family protein